MSANADNAHAKRGTGVIGSEVGMCTRGDDDNRVPFSSPLTWTSHNSHRTFLAPPRRAKRRAMKIQTVLDVFHERVPAAFGFLTNPYGFKLVRDDDYAFVAKAAHCDVVVELDWGSIVVSLRPMVTGRAVRLSFIVGAQDPSILFLPRYPWGPEDALEEIDRQAELLSRFCADVLAGDFSEWSALEAHQQQVLEQWRRESERLVKEARLKLVRRRAEGAWQRRSFSEAAQLYASIRDDLNQAEIARHEYCHRRTILQPVRTARCAEEGLA